MSKVGARVGARIAVVLLTLGSLALADERGTSSSVAFYENPPVILIPGGGRQTNCADPTVIRGQAGDPFWYALCTSDSLSDDDVDAAGVRRQHLVPMLRSSDLVSWVYMGDAFSTRPAWVAPRLPPSATTLQRSALPSTRMLSLARSLTAACDSVDALI